VNVVRATALFYARNGQLLYDLRLTAAVVTSLTITRLCGGHTVVLGPYRISQTRTISLSHDTQLL